MSRVTATYINFQMELMETEDLNIRWELAQDYGLLEFSANTYYPDDMYYEATFHTVGANNSDLFILKEEQIAKEANEITSLVTDAKNKTEKSIIAPTLAINDLVAEIINPPTNIAHPRAPSI